MNKRAKRLSVVITSMFILAGINGLQAMNKSSNGKNNQNEIRFSPEDPSNISFNNNIKNQEVINTDINNKDNNGEEPKDNNNENNINNNNNEDNGEGEQQGEGGEGEQQGEGGEEEQQGEGGEEEQQGEEYQGEEMVYNGNNGEEMVYDENNGEEMVYDENNGEEQYEEQGGMEVDEGAKEDPKYPNENNINENNMIDSNDVNNSIGNNISDSNKINYNMINDEENVEEKEKVEENNVNQIKIKNNINQIKNSMNLNASKNLFGSQDNILGDTPQPPEEQEIGPNFSYNDFVNSSPRGVEDGYVQRFRISAGDFYSLLGHFRNSESVKIINDIKNLNKDLFKTKYRSIDLAGDMIGVLASVYDTNRKDITNYVFINYSKVDSNISQFDPDIKKSIEKEMERLSEEMSDKFSGKTTVHVRKYALDNNGIHSMN